MNHRHAPSGSSDEKYDIKVEHVESKVSSTEVVNVVDDDGELLLPGRRERAEKMLVRKLDFRLLPTIILIFILNYIDVGFAALDRSLVLTLELANGSVFGSSQRHRTGSSSHR